MEEEKLNQGESERKREREGDKMESGTPEGKSGDTAKAKKDGKRGENVKFYLQPEDVFTLNAAMQEDGFDARGHYLLYLIRQRQVWADWRRQRARALLREVAEAGLTVEELAKERNAST